MIKTALLAEELRSIGITPPPRPEPPFDVLPEDPTEPQRELDRAYQAACVEWIKAVASLHYRHHLGRVPPTA